MKLIERVYYSLVGKKVKTLLLLLVVTLLGSFLSASFSIYQANISLENTVLEKLNPVILVDWLWYSDGDNVYFDNEEEIFDIIEKYKKDERIKVIENRYTLEDSRQFVSIANENHEFIRFTNFGNIKYFYPQEVEVVFNNTISMYATDRYQISDIENGNTQIISGRIFNEEELENGEDVFLYINSYGNDVNLERIKECKKHYFAIDKIVLEDIDNNNDIIVLNSDYKKEMKMVGIISSMNTANLKYHGKDTDLLGSYYVPLKTLEEISNDILEVYDELEKEYPWLINTYAYDEIGKIYCCDTYIELNDVNELDTLIKELKKECGNLVEGIYSYTDSYNDVKVVTNNLNTIAIISLVVCSIASIILLSLIIQVFVHERRHEIGIYLSMGESRKKVMTQILLEVLLIGMIGISLSIFSGHMISKGLSSDLLERQIIQQEEIQDDFNDDSFEINKEEILDTYSVEITAEYVICVYVGGFIVLILSSIYPMNSILKMKPKKMLM